LAPVRKSLTLRSNGTLSLLHSHSVTSTCPQEPILSQSFIACAPHQYSALGSAQQPSEPTMQPFPTLLLAILAFSTFAANPFSMSMPKIQTPAAPATLLTCRTGIRLGNHRFRNSNRSDPWLALIKSIRLTALNWSISSIAHSD
jgi:hypothetical protein